MTTLSSKETKLNDTFKAAATAGIIVVPVPIPVPVPRPWFPRRRW